MNLHISDSLIPGTKLRRDQMDGLTGLAFLSKVFFISDGVMLSQIRDVSGIDGSTLQNWTKRGWVPLSKNKKYDIDQVAYILIINMLRSCMPLERISFLLEYINGDLDDETDDIIRASVLYDYICHILDALVEQNQCSFSSIRTVIEHETESYAEIVSGAKERLTDALEAIVVAYYATLIKHHSDTLVNRLVASHE